jgi:chromosome partitioning protein
MGKTGDVSRETFKGRANMKIIAVANQKGGVAKTTTVINLASFISAKGKKTLIIDLDPQANATSGVGIEKDSIKLSIYEALLGNAPLSEVILPSPYSGLFVAPASLSLVGAEVELVSAARRELRLADQISQNASINQYDFVIIDTPPSLGLLTLNALTASQSVLIPMQCEYYALEGLAQLYKTIQLVKQNTNPGLHIEGLVFSMVDARANLTLQVIAEVKKFLQDKVYESIIPRNIRLAEAPGFGKPIMAYDKHSKGAEAYRLLAEEFLRRNSTETPSPLAGEGRDEGAQSGNPSPAPSPETGEGHRLEEIKL